MPDAEAAERKFAALVDEAQRWKGAPEHTGNDAGRRSAAWPDMEIRQAGRGIMVRVRAPHFDRWWNQAETWAADPMGALFDWIGNE